MATEGNDRPPMNGCDEYWGWDPTDKSHEIRIQGPNQTIAYFHPNWSSGTAAVRATRDINNSKSYWEVSVSQRLFGTSMMFGIGTKQAGLHANVFINLVGDDTESWGLSHKGQIWHDGKFKQFTKPFRENVETTIGMLFDASLGTLTYFKDGVNLGVAFTGLDKVRDELYPMASSTAAKTEMTLVTMKRDFINLQDRCRNVILQNIQLNEVDYLEIPKRLKMYVREGREKNSKIQTSSPFKIKSSRTKPTSTTLVSYSQMRPALSV